jgi:membrane protein DedA with SNARE-associated domain
MEMSSGKLQVEVGYSGLGFCVYYRKNKVLRVQDIRAISRFFGRNGCKYMAVRRVCPGLRPTPQ